MCILSVFPIVNKYSQCHQQPTDFRSINSQTLFLRNDVGNCNYLSKVIADSLVYAKHLPGICERKQLREYYEHYDKIF